MSGRPPVSLRGRAVAWLAQREHSELELRRKLMRQLEAEARGIDAEAPADADLRDGVDPRAQVDEVIAWLVDRGYLDSARFIASRVHLRAGRHGLARIQQELSRHGLALDADALRSLRDSELERARAVWARKFGTPPDDARSAARQARFLASRGFSGEVVRQLLRATAGGEAQKRRPPQLAADHDES